MKSFIIICHITVNIILCYYLIFKFELSLFKHILIQKTKKYDSTYIKTNFYTFGLRFKVKAFILMY